VCKPTSFHARRISPASFKTQGFDVIHRGFHVSGAIAMSPTTRPPECQEMLDAGVTLVLGEVEGRLGCHPSRRAGGPASSPSTTTFPRRPSSADMPLPRASRSTQRRFVMTHGRDHRRRPWLPVLLLVLYHHQRPGPADAVAKGHGDPRPGPARNYWLKSRRASVTISSPTTTSRAIRSGRQIFDGLNSACASRTACTSIS